MSRNTYFLCPGNGKAPIVWDPHDRSTHINVHTDYYGRAIEAMEAHLRNAGYTVYLTWNLAKLPSYGEKVVAIVLGDEWCRIPAYAHRVHCVFKCYGVGPELGFKLFSPPTYQRALTLLQYIQARLRYAPGWIRARFRSRHGRSPLDRIHSIPLGYANQLEAAIKPFASRRFDLSFAGSIAHKSYPVWSPKRWFQTPKSFARHAMTEALKRCMKAHPDRSIDLKITASYRAIRTADPVEYSRRMMDTRICLAPRGTSFETFRFYEGMRYGCIVVTEFLPSRWFYDGSPAIIVGDWNELEDVVAGLFADPDRMNEMHRAALRWWEDRCSPQALGRFMAHTIDTQS